MSTRAIIGIQKADGMILGAWQWNDGSDLIGVLNEHFNTPEKATLLISHGIWNNLMTQKEAEEFDHWFFTELHKGKTAPEQYAHFYIDVCGIKLLKHHHQVNSSPTLYPDFETALGQDINYLYLFNEAIGKWDAYS